MEITRVESVGIATSHSMPQYLRDKIERVTIAALRLAQEGGITGAEELRAIILAARDSVVEAD